MSFSTILFTEKGRALQAKALAGATLNFTKLVMGSGSLGGASPITLIAVIEPKVTLSISYLKHNSNYATIQGVFNNSDISIGFYWREIGVYAQDPDIGEILYCYGNAGALAEYIPSQSSEIIEKVVSISAIVGNATTVTASIDESLVYVSKNELDALVTDLSAKTASGTGTSISITMESISSYFSGLKVTIIATNDNNAASTTLKINNLDALPIYKANTIIAPKISLGKPYTFILSLDLSHFFLDASAEGTADVGDVLADKTFSNDNDSGLTGTMVNNGAVSQNITIEGAEYTIPAGYHNGLGKVKAVITNLIASVIKAGVTAGGILGTFTADATADASKILTGYFGYKNGAREDGSMPDKRFVTKGDMGYTGASSFKQDGYGSITIAPTTGYYDSAVNSLGNGEILITDTDFIAPNIPLDMNFFGLQGTRALGKKFASGSANSGGGLPCYSLLPNYDAVTLPCITVSSLSFKPKSIVVRPTTPNNTLGHTARGRTNYSYNPNSAGVGTVQYSNESRVLNDTESTAGASYSIYVNASGFRLPVNTEYGTAFTWEAWE